MVTNIQAKHSCKKRCVFFAMLVSSDKGKDVEDVEVLKGSLVLQ